MLTLNGNKICKKAGLVIYKCILVASSDIVANNYPLIVPTGYRPKTTEIIHFFNDSDRSCAGYGILETNGKLTIYFDIKSNYSYSIEGCYFVP